MITPTATALWLMLVALIPTTAAQTEANCTVPQYNWMFNSVGLSPCHVGDQLAQPCGHETFTTPPLPVAGEAYYLSTNYENDTACQNGTWYPWASFATNCTATSLTVYPNPIPPNVIVPHWAYLNVNDTGTFNVINAEDAGGAESTSPASATSTSTFTSSSTSSATASSSSSPQPSSTSTSTSTSSTTSSSAAGPIAGGVVGGVVGLALIVGVATFFYRRGRSDQLNSLVSGPDVLSTSPPAWKTSPLVPTLRPQKLYDPQDPSTFPPDMNTVPPLEPQSLTGTTYNTTRQDAQQFTPGATYYTGVPEV